MHYLDLRVKKSGQKMVSNRVRPKQSVLAAFEQSHLTCCSFLNFSKTAITYILLPCFISTYKI